MRTGRLILGTIALMAFSCAREQTAPESTEKHAEDELPEIVTLPEAAAHSIRTAALERRLLKRQVRAPGRVEFDPGRTRKIVSRLSGFVETIHAYDGDRVKSAQIVLTLFSSDLSAMESDYLEFKKREAGTEPLASAAGANLLRVGLAQQDLAEIERTGLASPLLPVRSPLDGRIVGMKAAQGERIEPGNELLTVVDARRMWVVAEVAQHDLAWIKIGQRGRVTSTAYPNRSFEASVRAVAPALRQDSQTLPVTLEVENASALLKAEMFVEVKLEAETFRALAAPEGAISEIDDQDVVFVHRGDGSYSIRRIEPGLRSDGWVELRGEIGEGEQVVVEGTFLLKSEALKGTIGEEG